MDEDSKWKWHPNNIQWYGRYTEEKYFRSFSHAFHVRCRHRWGRKGLISWLYTWLAGAFLFHFSSRRCNSARHMNCNPTCCRYFYHQASRATCKNPCWISKTDCSSTTIIYCDAVCVWDLLSNWIEVFSNLTRTIFPSFFLNIQEATSQFYDPVYISDSFLFIYLRDVFL